MDQTKTYDALKLENQLCFPLYACSRQVVSLYTPLLKPLGLTYTQYIVLMVLWEEKDGIPVGVLGKKLHLDNGTLTPLLKKMETAGLVTRNRSDQDERVVVVGLTASGWELREAAKDIPEKMGRCLKLSPEDAATLYKLLYQILDTL